MSSWQHAFMTQKMEELAKKAGMRSLPQLCVSKNERLASVNVFQRRISIGEHLMELWRQGKLCDADIEAILAHEFGHLMDFSRNSRSSNFRNLLIESIWMSFGVTPLLIFLFYSSFLWLAISAVLALSWGGSLPWMVRRVELSVEFEADRNAALYLVEPQQLANALVKIKRFGAPPKKLGSRAKLAFVVGTLMHPSFNDRVHYLQGL